MIIHLFCKISLKLNCYMIACPVFTISSKNSKYFFIIITTTMIFILLRYNASSFICFMTSSYLVCLDYLQQV